MFNKDSYIPFDFNMPIYNWFYPMSYKEIKVDEKSTLSAFNNDLNRVRNRALYFHIPFCEDICAFCPFVREVLRSQDRLNNYVDALVKEIEIKSKIGNVSKYPITAIFFGGGTPSILKPNHILKIGNAIKNNFDLSHLKEFSFEMNAKTVEIEKIKALKEIGVTHARMGVQTFNPKYRDIFRLSATIDNIYNGAKLLNENFDYTCVDMLYGMHGQCIDEVIKDLKNAIDLGTTHIDVYPINNGVIQDRLKKSYDKHGLKAHSALSKHLFVPAIYDYMKYNNFLPHNGHGYVRVKDYKKYEGKNFVYDEYSFQYHESVYGYSGHEVIAFGVVGYSVLNEYVVGNVSNIDEYVQMVVDGKLPIAGIGIYNRSLTDIKGIALHLPYHGVAYKKLIDENIIDDELTDKLNWLKEKDMIVEYDDRWAVTRLGWLNYVNLLYFLSPKCEQERLNKYIEQAKLGNEFNSKLLF